IWTRNTATPATPDEGEYGYDGTTYYIHLPGALNPNEYRVEVVTVSFLVWATNDTLVTVTDGHVSGSQSACVNAGDATTGGEIYALDTVAEYSRGSGFATMGPDPTLTAIRCTGRYVL